MRALIYLVVGWVLLAAVGGLGQALSLTIVLPATSAALVAHAVFTRDLEVPAALFVAVALGYLEDMHQGTPAGLLSLTHGLACLALVWTRGRLALEGPVARALAAGACAALIDLGTFALLLLLRFRLGLSTTGLLDGLYLARWHALATLLAAPAVFLFAELALRGWGRARGRVSDRPRPLERTTWYRRR